VEPEALDDTLVITLAGARPLDLGVIDVLARFALEVRRIGFSIGFHDPPARVLELLDLAGMDTEMRPLPQ
jgi:hypothetical protein